MQVIIEESEYLRWQSELEASNAKERELEKSGQYFMLFTEEYTDQSGWLQRLEVVTPDAAAKKVFKKLSDAQAELEKYKSFIRLPWYKRIFAKCP